MFAYHLDLTPRLYHPNSRQQLLYLHHRFRVFHHYLLVHLWRRYLSLTFRRNTRVLSRTKSSYWLRLIERCVPEIFLDPLRFPNHPLVERSKDQCTEATLARVVLSRALCRLDLATKLAKLMREDEIQFS